MSCQTVVVRSDRRRREAGVGWCWSAVCDGHAFELMIADDILDLLNEQGLSPFLGDHATAAIFFDMIEAGVRRRLARESSKPVFIILSDDDLLLGDRS